MKTFLKTLTALTLATAFLLTGCETPDVSSEDSSNINDASSETSSDTSELTSSSVSKDTSSKESSVTSSDMGEDVSRETSSDVAVFVERAFAVTEAYPQMGRHLASVDVTISLPSDWNPTGDGMISVYNANGTYMCNISLEAKWYYENNPWIIRAQIMSNTQLTIGGREYDVKGYKNYQINKRSFYIFKTLVGAGDDLCRLYVVFYCDTISDEQQELYVQILESMTVSDPYYKDYSQP